MRKDFPTRDVLEVMPIHKIRLIDIREKDEEELVQEVLSAKISRAPESVKEVVIKVPDIKTREEEVFWQAKLDEERIRARKEAAIKGAIEPDSIEVKSNKKIKK